jgi:predicted glycoside hydrolase/deacetylase ChbG (UPF0249 family)
MSRTLVVNADDFGFTHDVNSGIIEAHTRGILTATTLMANAPASADAVRLAREHPTLDVGCHLVLVQGPGLPGSVRDLIVALALRRIDPYAVLRQQVERILAAGLKPLHLDTHKHTHLLPPVLDAVARLSQEYRIPWVRRPFDLPLSGGNVPRSKRIVNALVGSMRSRVHGKLAAHGCRTTDHFAGFQLTGRFHAADLVALIRSLPDGITEFMCHPGHCTDELRACTTRLKESRALELHALTAPEVHAALAASGVRLAGYRDLS